MHQYITTHIHYHIYILYTHPYILHVVHTMPIGAEPLYLSYKYLSLACFVSEVNECTGFNCNSDNSLPSLYSKN